MSGLMHCEEHGSSQATRVCAHIIETLEDGEPRGFWYAVGEDDYQALCTTCENMPEEQWEQEVDSLVRVLCFGCFLRAAELNGVEFEVKH